MKQIELTSKLVVALIATVVVFSAMTVPVAAQTTSSPPIRANSVTSGSIKDGEVKTDDLADNAVTSRKIADGTIQEQDIADGVIPDGGGALPNVHIVKGEIITLLEQFDTGFSGAHCPDGEKVTGGGYDTTPSIFIIETLPVDENTWRVFAINSGGAASNTFQAYAICMGPSQ